MRECAHGGVQHVATLFVAGMQLVEFGVDYIHVCEETTHTLLRTLVKLILDVHLQSYARARYLERIDRESSNVYGDGSSGDHFLLFYVLAFFHDHGFLSNFVPLQSVPQAGKLALTLVALLHYEIVQELTFSTSTLVVSFEDALFSLAQIAGVKDTFHLPSYAFLSHSSTLGCLVSALIVIDGLGKGELSLEVLAELHILVGLIIAMILLQDLLEALLGTLDQMVLLVYHGSLIGQANDKQQPSYPLFDVQFIDFITLCLDNLVVLMDNFRVALDSFDYPLFFVDEACGNLISFETVDHHIDILDLALESFAIFTDDLEIQVVVVHWLALFYAIFVVKDESKQLVLFGNKIIEKGLKRVADGELAISDGTDESGGLKEEIQEIIVLLHVRTADGVISQGFILVDGANQLIDSLQISLHVCLKGSLSFPFLSYKIITELSVDLIEIVDKGQQLYFLGNSFLSLLYLNAAQSLLSIEIFQVCICSQISDLCYSKLGEDFVEGIDYKGLLCLWDVFIAGSLAKLQSLFLHRLAEIDKRGGEIFTKGQGLIHFFDDRCYAGRRGKGDVGPSLHEIFNHLCQILVFALTEQLIDLRFNLHGLICKVILVEAVVLQRNTPTSLYELPH